MRIGRGIAAIFAAMVLAGFAVGAMAASAPPPLPRPRPDHNAQPEAPATAPGQETDEQKRIRQGIPDEGPDSDALMPPVNGDTDPSKVGTTPQPVTLTASITDKGGRINDGLTWRIFSTKPDKDGKVVMVAKSEKPAPVLTLPPGDYVVDVTYGQAQTSDTLSVGGKPANVSVVLDAGGLKLNAQITGDLPIPFNLLHFDIFTAGASDSDRALVAEKVSANDILTLNAGTYHVVSYFGDVNAIVRADLRVEPGQLTDATLFHKAAQVSLKLASEAGGEAIADVDWTVKASDGTQVFANTGTFPSAVLEEGTYTVSAKRGDKTYSKQFQVTAGRAQDVEVLTTAG